VKLGVEEQRRSDLAVIDAHMKNVREATASFINERCISNLPLVNQTASIADVTDVVVAPPASGEHWNAVAAMAAVMAAVIGMLAFRRRKTKRDGPSDVPLLGEFN